MILGHYGLAVGLKAREPATPLWVLMLATVWLDIVFVPLLAIGAESLEKVAGAGPYGGLVIHANYTHSLVGAAFLSVALGLTAARGWGPRSGVVVGLVSLSHWLLDLVVHRGDLPLLPGNAGDLPTLGFGLWRMPLVSIAVEIVIFLLGLFAYWRAADAVARSSRLKPGVVVRAVAAALLFGGLVMVLDVTGLLE